MAPKKSKPKTVHCHLISVATGSVAWQIINGVATQFPSLKVKLTAHTFVESEAQIQAVFRRIRGKNVWVFDALLDPALKAVIKERCKRRKIPRYDMTGGVLEFVSQNSGLEPANEPNLELDEGYFQRLDSLEFTLQHDDSRRLESLADADIIVIGLSRVSKTPTSCYLGMLGFKVANVSLVPEIGLPKELKRSMKRKVVALTVKPKRLQQIRSRRMSVNKFDSALAASGAEADGIGYVDLKSIVREVMEAESIYRERQFPVIDITDQSVDVTATEILETLGLERPFVRTVATDD